MSGQLTKSRADGSLGQKSHEFAPAEFGLSVMLGAPFDDDAKASSLSVFVRGLPIAQAANAAGLRIHFEPFGAVASIVVRLERSEEHQSSCWGIVTFQEADAATKARNSSISVPDELMNEVPLKIARLNVESMLARPRELAALRQACTVRITGAPESCEDRKVKAIFAPVGEVYALERSPGGGALVQFRRADHAALALNLKVSLKDERGENSYLKFQPATTADCCPEEVELETELRRDMSSSPSLKAEMPPEDAEAAAAEAAAKALSTAIGTAADQRSAEQDQLLFDWVSSIAFFAANTSGDDVRRELTKLVRIVTCEIGENICVQDERGEDFFVLISGAVDVIIDGKRLGRMQVPGQAFGDLALTAKDSLRTATIVASEKTVLVALDAASYHAAIAPVTVSTVADSTGADRFASSAPEFNSEGVSLSILPDPEHIAAILHQRVVGVWYHPSARARPLRSGGPIGESEYLVCFINPDNGSSRRIYVPRSFLDSSLKIAMMLEDLAQRSAISSAMLEQTAQEREKTATAALKIQGMQRGKSAREEIRRFKFVRYPPSIQQRYAPSACVSHKLQAVTRLQAVYRGVKARNRLAGKVTRPPPAPWPKEAPPAREAINVMARRETIQSVQGRRDLGGSDAVRWADDGGSDWEGEASTSREASAQQKAEEVAVEYLVPWADGERHWISRRALVEQTVTRHLVESYERVQSAKGDVMSYLTAHPDSVNIERKRLRDEIRAAHGWVGRSGLSRRECDTILAQLLASTATKKQCSSSTLERKSRDRAAVIAAAREEAAAQEVRKQQRRQQRTRRCDIGSASQELSSKESRKIYPPDNDVLPALILHNERTTGSRVYKLPPVAKRPQWRHHAVLMGMLDELESAREERQRWQRQSGEQHQVLSRSMPDLGRGTTGVEITTSSDSFARTGGLAARGAGVMLSTPNQGLPTHMMYRTEQQQRWLCETVLGQWEAENASKAATAGKVRAQASASASPYGTSRMKRRDHEKQPEAPRAESDSERKGRHPGTVASGPPAVRLGQLLATCHNEHLYAEQQQWGRESDHQAMVADANASMIGTPPPHQPESFPDSQSRIADRSSLRSCDYDNDAGSRVSLHGLRLPPTPTRRQAAKGAAPSVASIVRGVPLSRNLRQHATLVAEGFNKDDCSWALQRSGLGGLEEARDMLLHAQNIQSRGQYEYALMAETAMADPAATLVVAKDTRTGKRNTQLQLRQTAVPAEDYTKCSSLEAVSASQLLGVT